MNSPTSLAEALLGLDGFELRLTSGPATGPWVASTVSSCTWPSDGAKSEMIAPINISDWPITYSTSPVFTEPHVLLWPGTVKTHPRGNPS